MAGKLDGVNVISIVGSQGSGKSTIGDKLSLALSLPRVEVSDVVKDKTQLVKRETLAKSGELTKHDPSWLGGYVAKAVLDECRKALKETVVLTGVREVEVHNMLRKCGAKLFIVDLQADAVVRYMRLKDLGKVENAEQFLLVEMNEKKLGLEKVRAEAKHFISTKPSAKPHKVAKALIDLVVKKELV